MKSKTNQNQIALTIYSTATKSKNYSPSAFPLYIKKIVITLSAKDEQKGN
jgi:hypothetical protein